MNDSNNNSNKVSNKASKANKGYKNKNKGNKGNKKKGSKPRNNDKIKGRIQRMIQKTQSLKEKKNQEIDLLNSQQTQLQKLYDDADNLDFHKIKLQIKNIVKSYKIKREKKLRRKNNRKRYGGKNKGNKDNKGHKGKWNKEDKEAAKLAKKQKKEEKQLKKEENKRLKEERKAQKLKIKQEKQAKKEERKRIKKEKLEKLDAARLLSLPLTKKDIGNKSSLFIYIDGYNIIGCDSECRKNMRGRGKGMGSSRNRLIKDLLQKQFLDQNAKHLSLPYNITVYCWFDGGSTKQNHKSGDIEVTFSTKAQIVDDKLVELFSKNSYGENANIMVVTSDKELTLRLYDIGIKVMKSSTFYKSYLVEQELDSDDEDFDDIKKDEIESTKPKPISSEPVIINTPGYNDNEDVIFNKYCAQKMHSQDDDTPDDEDYDFEETFGEDMDTDDDSEVDIE